MSLPQYKHATTDHKFDPLRRPRFTKTRMSCPCLNCTKFRRIWVVLPVYRKIADKIRAEIKENLKVSKEIEQVLRNG